ncbi:MAG: M23 family metallopeptidase [Gemmatimonadetes bacterium]|nr:M23 family metallopeptidase [Gemmatimonadota bacterium]
MRPRYLLATLLLAGCSGSVLDELRPDPPPTPHARYAASLRAAGLDSTALGAEWLAAGDSALAAPLEATLPLRELGSYSRAEARAVAYRVRLRGGERLEVLLDATGQPTRLYLELFEATGDTAAPFRHLATAVDGPLTDSAAANLALRHEVDRDATLLIRLQPELLRSGRYELRVQAGPSLAFPVEGAGNGAIQSFFGADREAGRRSHQGIDIFAPRGTPVLAATAGVVRSTRPNSLGGNVVWLRDEQRGTSLYYAHLDAHAVVQGQRVEIGDTLGFVGNSGNARTTPPHLHFGIYRRGEGAIDPLPWVRLATATPGPLRADTTRLGAPARTAPRLAALRAGPSRRDTTLREVPAGTSVVVMAATSSWYRVQLDDGTAGYVEANLVRSAVE